jgi:hypothetical protein
MTDPVVKVPAEGALPASGADNIVGTYSAPNPGAQPGEVAEQPLTEGSAADPNPTPTAKVPPEDKIQTADDPNPEATAKGATDPAVHNPRGPVDGSGVGNLEGGTASAGVVPIAPSKVTTDEPTNEETHPTHNRAAHNRNALRGVPTGPAHTQHSRPVRRGEV